MVTARSQEDAITSTFPLARFPNWLARATDAATDVFKSLDMHSSSVATAPGKAAHEAEDEEESSDDDDDDEAQDDVGLIGSLLWESQVSQSLSATQAGTDSGRSATDESGQPSSSSCHRQARASRYGSLPIAYEADDSTILMALCTNAQSNWDPLQPLQPWESKPLGLDADHSTGGTDHRCVADSLFARGLTATGSLSPPSPMSSLSTGPNSIIVETEVIADALNSAKWFLQGLALELKKQPEPIVAVNKPVQLIMMDEELDHEGKYFDPNRVLDIVMGVRYI